MEGVVDHMNKELFVSGLKSNWHLVLVCLGFFVVAAAWALKPSDNGHGPVAIAAQTQPKAESGAMRPHTSRWARPTAQQEVQNAIDDYQRDLSENRRSPETAANLFRLGNLYYSKQQNYEQASLYYEILLQDFPDYKRNNTVYPNLATCYERLGKMDLERHTYKQMREYFSPDSQDYVFATQKLGY